VPDPPRFDMDGHGWHRCRTITGPDLCPKGPSDFRWSDLARWCGLRVRHGWL